MNHYWSPKVIGAALTPLLLLSVVGCQRSRNKLPQFGRIMITSEPTTGAAVSIDGKPVDRKTNTVIARVKPGTHLIELAKPNPLRPDVPEVGQAQVNVAAGKTTRVTVRLGFMAIVPAAGQLSTVTETESEKSIIEYFRALNAKDYRTAYSYLSQKLRARFTPSYSSFIKKASQVKEIRALGMRKRRVDPAAGTETDELQITISRLAVGPNQTTPEKLTVLITTLPDYSGIRKLDEIVSASNTPVGPTFAKKD